MAEITITVVLNNHDDKYEIVSTDPAGYKPILEEVIQNYPFFLGVEIGRALDNGIKINFEVE